MDTKVDTKTYPVTHTDAEWRKLLTPEQFHIMREHGTERPGSCALNFEKRAGTFSCAGCGQALFKSKKKFESGTGWPSFNDPEPGAVEETVDRAYGMVRTEVHCSRCGSHLGHVFPDGPPPTGLALLHQRRGDELQAGLNRLSTAPLSTSCPGRMPGHDGNGYRHRSNIRIALFDGISTSSTKRSPFAVASVRRSAVSRTPHSGFRRRRLSSNAALLGALCSPSRWNGP